MGAAQQRVPRVAMVARNARGQTGLVNLLLEHARLFTKHGWNVTVAADRIDPAALAKDGIVGKRIRESWLPFLKVPRTAFQKKAEQWLAGQRFDLVVAHGDLLVQDVLNVHNCVHWAHELIEGRPPGPEHDGAAFHHALLSGQRFQVLVANSDLMRRDLQQRFSIPTERITVIRCGYDPERFRREDRDRYGPALRATLGVPPGRLLLGFITSGNFRKRGLDLLIQAIAGLSADVRAGLQVVVVGSDSSIDRHLVVAGQLGIRDHFTVVGRQTHIERYHHAMDLFVLPARIEEFGQAPQEAMICGVPSIITDRMGVAELLTGQDRPGVLPAGDVEALRAALQRFLADRNLRERWAEECYQACRANTWIASWQHHLELYQVLLDRRLRLA